MSHENLLIETMQPTKTNPSSLAIPASHPNNQSTYLAKDVLFSYFVLILIVAILGLSVFNEILNPDSSTDTYHSSIRALITTFVFIFLIIKTL